MSVMAETVSSALNQARTKQNEIRGKINSLAEDDRSIKLGTLKAEIDIASKELTKAKGAASELQRRLSNLESDHVGKVQMLENAKSKLLQAESDREKAETDVSNASPDGIRQRLLEAQSMRMEAEGAANMAQVTLDSGQEKGDLLADRLDSLTSRADEIQADMAGREKSVEVGSPL